MEFIKKHWGIIITIISTIILMSILFLIKGIYPFGDSIFNIIDFDSGYIPVYYKFWDFLHGSGSLLFDWNLGGGLNCFGSIVSNSLLSPTSWLIFFSKRDFIPYFMSFILIIKIVEISTITYISLSKIFPKLNTTYKIIGTLTYTFSGWTLLMFSNILYLDVAALFPLFVYAFIELLKHGKWKLYVSVLTLCLLLSFYMSYLILFFIIGTTILAMLILDIKEKKKKSAMVTVLTLLSLALSCCLFLPAFSQSMSSFRMSDTTMGVNNFVFYEKFIHLLPLSLPIVIVGKSFTNKKDKKFNIFLGLLLFYLLIGIFVEPINRMWHTGSYWSFPFRYSFIPTFVLILGALRYLNKEKEPQAKKSNLVSCISCYILLIIIGIFAYLIKDTILLSNLARKMTDLKQFIGLIFITITLIICSILIMKNNKKYRNPLMVVFCIVNIIIFGCYYIDNGSNGSSVLTNQIKNNFNLPKDNYNYLDYTGELNINFPYILQVPSLENRLHIIKEDEVNFMNQLGYNTYGTIMYSYGGTYFSDILANNRYIISKEKLSDTFYNLLENKDDTYLYELKYRLNYLIPYDEKIYNEVTNNTTDNQNRIYQLLMNSDKEIIHELMPSIEGDTIKYELIENNLYYLEADIKSEFAEQFEIPDYYRDNTIQTSLSYVQNEIYHSQIFTSSKGNIAFNSLDNSYKNIKVYYINEKEIIDFIDNKKMEVKLETIRNKRTLTIKTDKEENALIPLNYDEGITITRNDEKIPYSKNIYNMISIKLEDGENKIEISYFPKLLKEGIIISLISFLAILLVLLIDKKINLLNNKFIINSIFIISCLIGLIFILKVYILTLFG